MSRRGNSGWSAAPSKGDDPFVTSSNAVPLGTRPLGGAKEAPVSAATIETAAASPPKSGFSMPDNLTQAAGLNFSAAYLSPAPLDQASKHARKVYIGNLPPSVTQEVVIAQFFNQTLAALLPNKPPGDSIVGTYLNVAKRFAFIENRSIEETTFTLNLDGIQMDGYALKLRRPQDYNPRLAQQQLAVEMQLKGGISSLRGAANLSSPQNFQPDSLAMGGSTAPGIVSTSVEDGPNKVFVGGLPHQMTETDVKELLCSFGPLKAFHLVKDRDTDRSKGFAFCEFRDPSLTDIACSQLNGMKVGDRFLNVRRAIGHQQHKIGGIIGMQALEAAQQPLALTYDIAAAEVAAVTVPALRTVPNLGLPDITKQFRPESCHSSRCLAVRRIVPADQEVNVEVLVSLLSAVKKACAELGRVRNAIFHHSCGGQILVEFATPEEAANAQQKLDKTNLGDVEINCALIEMIPELTKTCIKRMSTEVERIARMEPEARALYYAQEKKMRDRYKVNQTGLAA